jgi:ATP-binding cassette, subfamily C, bacterial
VSKHRARNGLRLLHDCRPSRRTLLAVAGWSVVESAPALLSGFSVAHSVDAFRDGRLWHAVAWLAALAAAVVVGAVATSGLYAALAEAVEGTRDRLMTEVARGSLATVATTGRPGSAALTQLIDQIDQVRNLLSALGRGLRSTLIPLAAAIGGSFVLDPRLGLVVVGPTALAFVLYGAMLPRTVAAQRDAALADEALGGQGTAVLDNSVAVRGLGAERWAVDWVADLARSTGRADVRVSRMIAARHLVIAVGGYLPLLLVLIVSGPLLHHGQLSVGDVVGAMTYVTAALLPALSATVSGGGSWLVQLFVLLDRVASVAAVGPPTPVHVVTDPAATETVFARAATFEYRTGARAIVDHLSLSVDDGQLVALVGASGAGKTTLAHLVAGLLRPTSGAVGAGPARRLVLVPQTPYVFSGTLRDNLAYLASVQLTDADLEAAVDGAGLRPLLDRIGGLDADAPLDDLSGGERQRIVLARAWLCAADVIVLDEAMTLLDVSEEERLESWLRRTGRTLIAISHRLEIAHRADLIVYFDGREVRAGSHRELLSDCPEYRELVAYAASG